MPDDVPEDAGAVVAAPAADPLARDAANAWNAAAAAARGLFSALPVSDDELFVELMLALLRFVLRCATFRRFTFARKSATMPFRIQSRQAQDDDAPHKQTIKRPNECSLCAKGFDAPLAVWLSQSKKPI